MSALQFTPAVGHFSSQLANNYYNSGEPMNLGSPSNIHAHSPVPQFLPSFLMGDNNNNNSTPSIAAMSSTLPYSSPFSQPSNQSRIIQPRLSGMKSSTPLEATSRRHASPPTQGLWSNNLNSTRCGSQLPDDSKQGIPAIQNNNNNSPSPSYLKPDFASPYNAAFSFGCHSPRSFLGECGNQLGSVTKRVSPSTEDDASNLWITVFGYPASQASFILQQFSYFGTIEKYYITNDGNWMHIKYQNPIQAKCALNKNGRVFAGNIMIGVRRCTDSEIMQGSKAVSGDLSSLTKDMATRPDPKTIMHPPVAGYRSPALGDISNTQEEWKNRSFSSIPHQVNSPVFEQRPSGLARHSSMRPLAATYRPPRGVLSRNAQGQSFKANSMNSKSSGLLSKAFDYVFGWN